MSAPVTEAHRKLAADLCRNATGSNRALHHVPKFAQLIADSEAKACAELRAESAEREVERLGHLEAVLRSSASDMTAGSITAGGVADLRAEVERWELAFQEQFARAERAEADLATERARLDWLEGNAGDIPRYHSRSWIWIAQQNLREKIDAAMKADQK